MISNNWSNPPLHSLLGRDPWVASGQPLLTATGLFGCAWGPVSGKSWEGRHWILILILKMMIMFIIIIIIYDDNSWLLLLWFMMMMIIIIVFLFLLVMSILLIFWYAWSMINDVLQWLMILVNMNVWLQRCWKYPGHGMWIPVTFAHHTEGIAQELKPLFHEGTQ